MSLYNLIILAVMGAGVWWLTGFDKDFDWSFDGLGKKRYLPRILRTVGVWLCIAVLLWAAENRVGYIGIPLLLICPITLALLLRSSVSEAVTEIFFRMTASGQYGASPHDPRKARRYLDTVGRLIQQGERDKAIQLCEKLKASGEVDPFILETTLEYLGVAQDHSKADGTLKAIRGLRSQGKFIEAAANLKSWFEQYPQDTEAAMLLMQIYSQDMHQSSLAHEVLRKLEKQPGITPAYVEFARRSLNEWSVSRGKMVEKAPQVPDSIDEALARGYVGTVIQRLEEQIRDEPGDLDLRLKLMEVQAVHCQNLPRANKMLRELASDPHFNPHQVEIATARVRAWHIAASNNGGA